MIVPSMAIVSSKKPSPESEEQQRSDLLPLEQAIPAQVATSPGIAKATIGKISRSKSVGVESATEALLQPEAEPEERSKQEEKLRPGGLRNTLARKT